MISATRKSAMAIKESTKDTMTVQYINPDENRILKLGVLTKKGNIKDIARVKEQTKMSIFERAFETLFNLTIKTPPLYF
jgi:hypothetical protein